MNIDDTYDMFMYICMYIWRERDIERCIYLYIHIYIYIYTYDYTYIYIYFIYIYVCTHAICCLDMWCIYNRG